MPANEEHDKGEEELEKEEKVYHFVNAMFFTERQQVDVVQMGCDK